MIRVVVVDDHPAVRAGLQRVIRGEPGFVPVGAAADGSQLWPLLTRTRPDVVLLDYHLPGSHGLVLCHRVKSTLQPPSVLIYTAFSSPDLLLPVALAGADGLVDKGAPVDRLFDALRDLARGARLLPPPPPELQEAAAAMLDPEDLPIVGMLLDDTPPREIAETLRIPPDQIGWRVQRILGRLTEGPRPMRAA
jgi:DNA-binding NarL/FixJ family response regulator